METNFEKVLQKVNKFVTLDPNDRQSYTRDFNEIATYLRRRMRELDPVFNQLYAGDSLGGSYGDGLKVTKPNEFDLIFQLKLPCQNLADIKVITDKPGYVQINIKEILERIRPQQNQKEVYNRLLKMVDQNNNIIQEKVQSWMEGIVTKALAGSTLKFSIEYKKTGPAHTLYIRQIRAFSIDFVPALVFNESSWVAMHPCPSNARNNNWHAVPKPIHDNDQRPNIAWITSYANFERELINRKANLKNVLKLMKKMRDRQNINNLKSYFIKTVFLLEAEEQSADFWTRNSTDYVFMHMFKRLLFHVENMQLPFFWDKRFNMFSKLSSNALKSMHGQLKAVYNFIEKNMRTTPELIFEKFLDESEIAAMSQGMNITEQTIATAEKEGKSWCTIM